MSTKRAIEKLAFLKQDGAADPKREWLENNRSVLLSQIKGSLPTNESLPVLERDTIWTRLSILLSPRLVYSVVRPLAVLMVVVLVGASGWIATVDASYQALPGDWLYPAKRLGEKAQAAVTKIIGDNADEAKLHINLAERRADEVKKIIQQNDPEKNKIAVSTVVDLKEEIDLVNKKLDESSQDGVDKKQFKANVAKDVKNKSENIKESMKKIKSDLSSDNDSSTKELAEEVSKTKELAAAVTVKASEVMVHGHLAGDQSITSEEVAKELNKVLDDVVVEVNESKQVVTGVKDVTQDAKKTVKQSGPTEGSANQQAAQVDKIANETVAAAIRTEAYSEQVNQQVSEARGFLQSGDLAEAVSKVKEASVITIEAGKVSDASVKQAEAVLPIVNQIINATAFDSLTASASGTVKGEQILTAPLSPSGTAIESTNNDTMTSTPKLNEGTVR